MLLTHKDILQKIEMLIAKDKEQDNNIMLIFEYLKQFEEAKKKQFNQTNRKRIGFKTGKE